MSQDAVDQLLDILDLEELEVNLFRGRSPQTGWQRVFGGQVIGQALVAAMRTVDEERPVHSLHGYFMRPGDPSVPIVYEAERYRDGRSFATRRVVAIQHGKPIFTMAASFHKVEEGLTHQIDMSEVPQPEDLPTEKEIMAQLEDRMPEIMRRYFSRNRAIELRRASQRDFLDPKPSEPEQHVWIRPTGKIPDDPLVHQAILAYASDFTLLDTALVPHATNFFDQTLQMASLDHAMWFHRSFRADDWLLYSQDSPTSGGSRGFTRGSIYNREGVLVASAVQEGLIRKKDPSVNK
ncbi:MAG: acyl-CoA thioesterase II [Pseudomonadota bacterium]